MTTPRSFVASLRAHRRLSVGLLAAPLTALVVILSLTTTSTPPRIWSTPEASVTYLANDTALGDRVQVMVGTSRDFGYRTGDIVPVRITVIADPGVSVNFEELKHEIIDLNGAADFLMEAPPSISQYEAAGKQVWQVDLYLHCFKKQASIDFTTSFYLSDQRLSDGEPDWVSYTTPLVTVTTTPTAPPNAQNFLMGDQSSRPLAVDWVGWLLLTLGGLLAVSVFLAVARAISKKRHLPFEVSESEVAWSVFDKVLQVPGSQWQVAQYQAIAAALRRYFEIESLTFAQVEQALSDRPVKERERLLATLARLDEQLYGNPDDRSRSGLRFALDKLVPRPGKD